MRTRRLPLASFVSFLVAALTAESDTRSAAPGRQNTTDQGLSPEDEPDNRVCLDGWLQRWPISLRDSQKVAEQQCAHASPHW